MIRVSWDETDTMVFTSGSNDWKKDRSVMIQGRARQEWNEYRGQKDRGVVNTGGETN